MVSREKQLKRLKKDAQRLWSDQQELFGRANGVARDALPHAQYLAKERVVPGARTIYDQRLKSSVGKGAAVGAVAGRYVSSTARDAVLGTIVPAVSSAAAAALTIAEEAGTRISGSADGVARKSKSASKVLDGITAKGNRSKAKAQTKVKLASKAGKVAATIGAAKLAKAKSSKTSKKGLGAGGVLGIILGLLALAGVGYAVWQTLRADDDLWVADDEPETTPNADGPTTA